MQKKTKTTLNSDEAEEHFLQNADSLSGADMEAILVRARMRAALDGREQVNVEDLKHAVSDFIPPSYPVEIELQNLAAVLECTSRSLLPEKYRSMDRGDVTRRAAELAALAG